MGSILSWAIPNTVKIVPVVSLLSIQDLRVGLGWVTPPSDTHDPHQSFRVWVKFGVVTLMCWAHPSFNGLLLNEAG